MIHTEGLESSVDLASDALIADILSAQTNSREENDQQEENATSNQRYGHKYIH